MQAAVTTRGGLFSYTNTAGYCYTRPGIMVAEHA